MANERIQLTDQQMFLSNVPEDNTVDSTHPLGTNRPRQLETEFVLGRYNVMMPPFPKVTDTPDDMIGDGSETSQTLRRGWWAPTNLTISGALNTETAAILGVRALSGTNSSTLVETGVSDRTTLTQTKAQKRLLKLSTIAFLMGAYDFVHISMGVASMELQFEGDGAVNFVCNLINTGYWNRLADWVGVGQLNPASNLGEPPTHHLMAPFATRVTFSDGSVEDFAADSRLVAGSCTLNNNVVVNQRPGDPTIDLTNRKSGAYARDIHRGRRAPGATLKVSMPGSGEIKEFTDRLNKTPITSLTYLFRSEEKVGATNSYYEYEWLAPIAELDSLTEDPDGEDAGMTMSFYIKKDPTTQGYWIQRVRTTTTLAALLV